MMNQKEQVDQQSMLPIGTTLQNGKYKVVEHLSSGGFGNTYIVINTKFDEKYAMKEFFMKDVCERKGHNTVSVSNSGNRESFAQQKEKFSKEAQRIRKFNNRHIVKVHDLFDENDTSYYIMDFISGGSLADRMKLSGIPFNEHEVLRFLPQILDGLEEVHRHSVWHLDLHPKNIMLDNEGNIVLIDFGASKQLNPDNRFSTSSAFCYHQGYAPTEQIDQNITRIGAWTDLYALGATLYNLLTKLPPLSTSEIQDGEEFRYPFVVNEKMQELIKWLMQPNRKTRPQSVEDVQLFFKLKLSNDPFIKEDEDKTDFGGKRINDADEPKSSHHLEYDEDETDCGGKRDSAFSDVQKHEENEDDSPRKQRLGVRPLITVLSIVPDGGILIYYKGWEYVYGDFSSNFVYNMLDMAPCVYPEEKDGYEKNDSKLHRTSKFEIGLDKYLEANAQILRTSKNYILYTDPTSYIGIEEIKVLFNTPVFRVFEEQQIIAYSVSKSYSNQSRIWIDMDGDYCYCDIYCLSDQCLIEEVGILSTKDVIQSYNLVKDNERLNYVIDGIREYEESINSNCKCGRLFQRWFPFTISISIFDQNETYLGDVGETREFALPNKSSVEIPKDAYYIEISFMAGAIGKSLKKISIKHYTEGFSNVGLVINTEKDDSVCFQFTDYISLQSSLKLRIGNYCYLPGTYKSASGLLVNSNTVTRPY